MERKLSFQETPLLLRKPLPLQLISAEDPGLIPSNPLQPTWKKGQVGRKGTPLEQVSSRENPASKETTWPNPAAEFPSRFG